jgi:hypothetical protein
MMDRVTLIKALETWTLESSDFHRDRQLADEVLLADGWKVEQNPHFEGGVAWVWGTSPKVLMADATRAHPINDLNAAFGVIPHGCDYRVDMWGGETTVYVWKRGPVIDRSRATMGVSSRPSVAILIAALRYMEKEDEMLRSKGQDPKPA